MEAESTATQAQTNGLSNGVDANYVTSQNGVGKQPISVQTSLRPVDVDADMREMSRRKRVEAILSSKTFRNELDRLIESGSLEGGAMGVQHVTDMLASVSVSLPGHSAPATGGLHCVQPIADLRASPETGQMSKSERMIRCKLASLLRLFDLHGWSRGLAGPLITVRISQDLEHFVVNPTGLCYSEVSASTLLKVDMQGGVVLPPGSLAAPDDDTAARCHHPQLQQQLAASFGRLHAPIHAARPDLRCVAHVQHWAVLAVSSVRAPQLPAQLPALSQLLPLTEHAARIGPVSSTVQQQQQQQQLPLERLLGVHNKVLLLTNQGALCCGESVDEVYYLTSQLIAACEVQVRLMPLGVDNLYLMDEEQRAAVYQESRRPCPVHGSAAAASADTGGGGGGARSPMWRLGEQQFEAAMRALDNGGYRTGHLYRQPGRGEPATSRHSDVEYPPAASSYSHYYPTDISLQSPVRRMFSGLRGSGRGHWLNTPNAYQKVEILESGTSDPKKITKWVSEDSASRAGTAVKVDSLQFVPKNTNPTEFKQLQQQIKENRRAGGVSAGPQSHILEGVRWDEARQSGDVTDSSQTTADQVVLVGAASKGIIQRDYQHHATVYKTPYAKNPFDQVSEEDLDRYRREVERKTRGDLPESEMVCAAASPGAPQHAEHVQLASDGEEATVDISRESGHEAGAIAANGEDTDGGHFSTLSQTDQEDISTSEASKKDKKKKKGLRTPSFLKKKKDKKRDKKEMLDASK